MKVKKIALKIGTSISGSSINIRGFSLEGSKPGKNIYIQGGMHGGEVTIWIFEKLFKYLAINSFKGKIVLIPIANPLSWNQRFYFSTVGKFDLYSGKDWNRNFPGDLNGSLSQKIAHTLFNIASKADFVLDLHTSRKSIPFSIATSKSNIEFAKIAGLEYCYLTNSRTSGLTQTLNGQLDFKNIPNLAIECGSHDSYNKYYVDCVFNSLVNLLKHHDAINSEIKNNHQVKFYTKYTNYRSPEGGFVRLYIKEGEVYKKGDTLYEVINPKSLVNTLKVKAKEDGVLIKISPTHIYMPGDEVLQSVPLDNLKNL